MSGRSWTQYPKSTMEQVWNRLFPPRNAAKGVLILPIFAAFVVGTDHSRPVPEYLGYCVHDLSLIHYLYYPHSNSWVVLCKKLSHWPHYSSGCRAPFLLTLQDPKTLTTPQGSPKTSCSSATNILT
jgi:hypothetical protein